MEPNTPRSINTLTSSLPRSRIITPTKRSIVQPNPYVNTTAVEGESKIGRKPTKDFIIPH